MAHANASVEIALKRSQIANANVIATVKVQQEAVPVTVNANVKMDVNAAKIQSLKTVTAQPVQIVYAAVKILVANANVTANVKEKLEVEYVDAAVIVEMAASVEVALNPMEANVIVKVEQDAHADAKIV